MPTDDDYRRGNVGRHAREGGSQDRFSMADIGKTYQDTSRRNFLVEQVKIRLGQNWYLLRNRAVYDR